ncbi:hypothetical protein H0A36_18865 [Endozoicomonas sp. SM1973]|uniref:Uncharacterized protein n=1 Tax=Spartinivicinus marinus TaxID=2994442 RepID=A0A853IDS8_9GAMM|nr:hypothetical protein [Spartinivicinus marinus]MCX4029750.1 hypothetical protein [Spartinivicinus marinus]NYZ68081.1 hypothetical protein [Spartinivicinus marinus]
MVQPFDRHNPASFDNLFNRQSQTNQGSQSSKTGPTTRPGSTASAQSSQKSGVPKPVLQHTVNSIIGSLNSDAVEDVNYSVSLNGDLSLQAGSILEARILAVKALLGSEGIQYEDEQLLNVANQIHANGAKPNATDEAKALSKALLNQEAILWGRQSSESGLSNGVNQERRLANYLGLWELSLNPPEAPQFKTRQQMAEEKVRRDYPDGNYGARPVGKLGVHDVTFNEKVNDVLRFGASNGLDKAYYGQFAEYINNNIEKLSSARAAVIAQNVGIGGGQLISEPKRVWQVNGFKEVVNKGSYSTSGGGYLGTSTRWELERESSNVGGITSNKPAYIFELKNGKFGMVKPDGSIYQFQGNPIGKDQLPNWGAIAEGLEVSPSETRYHVYSHKITNQHVGWERTTQQVANNRSLQNLIESNVRQTTTEQIDQWKDSNYGATGFQKFIRAVVPFYENIANAVNDPRSKLDVASLVLDSLDVGVTLLTMGAGAVGKAGFSAAKLAFKGASGLSKATNAVKAALQSVRTGNALKKAGKELADFVIPVFTAKDIVVSASKAGAKGVLKLTDVIRQQLRNSDELIKTFEPTSTVRQFKLGNKQFQGTLFEGQLWYKPANAANNWQPMNKVSELAYRLQNAGGLSKGLVKGPSETVRERINNIVFNDPIRNGSQAIEKQSGNFVFSHYSYDLVQSGSNRGVLKDNDHLTIENTLAAFITEKVNKDNPYAVDGWIDNTHNLTKRDFNEKLQANGYGEVDNFNFRPKSDHQKANPQVQYTGENVGETKQTPSAIVEVDEEVSLQQFADWLRPKLEKLNVDEGNINTIIESMENMAGRMGYAADEVFINAGQKKDFTKFVLTVLSATDDSSDIPAMLKGLAKVPNATAKNPTPRPTIFLQPAHSSKIDESFGSNAELIKQRLESGKQQAIPEGSNAWSAALKLAISENWDWVKGQVLG